MVIQLINRFDGYTPTSGEESAFGCKNQEILEILGNNIYLKDGQPYSILHKGSVYKAGEETVLIENKIDERNSSPTTEFNYNQIDVIIGIANNISNNYGEELNQEQCCRISTAYTLAYFAHFHQKRANNADYFQRHIIDLAMSSPRIYIPNEFISAETLTTYIEALLLHDVKEDGVKYKKLALTIDGKKKIYKIPISNIDEDKFSGIYSKETLTYKINNLVTKNERYESYLTKDNNHKLSNEQIEDIITNSKNSQYYLKNKTEIKNKQKKEYYDNIRNHGDKLEEEHIFTLWVKVADKIHNIKTIIGSGCTTEKGRERIDEAYTYLLNPLKKLKENDKYDQYKLFERVHNDLAQKYNNVDKYVNFVEEQE